MVALSIVYNINERKAMKCVTRHNNVGEGKIPVPHFLVHSASQEGANNPTLEIMEMLAIMPYNRNTLFGP